MCPDLRSVDSDALSHLEQLQKKSDGAGLRGFEQLRRAISARNSRPPHHSFPVYTKICQKIPHKALKIEQFPTTLIVRKISHRNSAWLECLLGRVVMVMMRSIKQEAYPMEKTIEYSESRVRFPPVASFTITTNKIWGIRLSIILYFDRLMTILLPSGIHQFMIIIRNKSVESK